MHDSNIQSSLFFFKISESSAQHISYFRSQIFGQRVLSFWSHVPPPLAPPLPALYAPQYNTGRQLKRKLRPCVDQVHDTL